MTEASARAGIAAAASGDPILTALERAPFRIHRPAGHTRPFVFASPHSGRTYPSSFVAQSRLSLNALRRSEDAFVDQLVFPVVAAGSPLLAAAFPRAYLDVNRAPQEFDAAMFEGPLPFATDTASPRVHAGLGVIPRIVREGAEIYRKKLSAAEASQRLAAFYRPYHAALAQLIGETQERFGMAIVVDCHSMPHAAAAPDIVLGDRYGLSAATPLIEAAEWAFIQEGFTVARNIPYAGGYTTQLHGAPGQGRHALQIEINRALYLDEENISPGPLFGEVRQRLDSSLRRLAAFDRELLLRRGFRQAAE